MGHLLVALLGAEVPDEEAGRVAGPLQAAVGPAAPVLRRHQMAIGPGGVGVGDDHVGGDDLAGDQAHAGGTLPGDGDLRHLGVAADLVALPCDEPHQALDQAAGAAHGRVHPPVTLQEGDQGIDGGDRQGVAADQQGMEGQDHAQARILDVLGDQAVDGPVAAQPHHVRDDLGHVPERVEGHVAELLEAHPIDGLAFLHVAVVAGDVAGGEAGDLGADLGRVAAVVEGVAIVEADAVKGHHGHEGDVVGEALAAQAPELLQDEGRGDDGRPSIEGKAILAEDIGPPARGVELLQDRHPIPPRPQAHRRRQAAKAAADDQGMRGHRSGW